MTAGIPTTRSRARRCAAAIPVVAALALPATAQAIDPGVNYDPTSPAGKEYAIPIVEGRAEGAGTEDQQGAANTAFGVGIRPPGAGGGRGDGDRGAAGADGRRGDRASRGAPRAARDRSAILDAEDAGGTAMASVMTGLAVVLLAALVAALLHARRPPRRARTAG